MRTLLVIIAVMIAYGSLYPFDFRVPDPAQLGAIVAHMLDPGATRRGDLLGNVALFLSFGFVGMFCPIRVGTGSRVARFVVVLVLAAVLAFVLQVAQLFTPGRDPSLVDVLWNVVGTAVGAGTALVPPLQRLLASRDGRMHFELPVVLAALWIARQLAPMVPSLDLQLVKASLKSLLQGPDLVVSDALVLFAAWLVVLHFLSSARLPRRVLRVLPLLPIAVLAAQPFIVRNNLTVAEVVGATGAIVVWLALRRILRPGWLAVLLATGMLVANLDGLRLDYPTNTFSWLPFSGFLDGSMVVNATALLEKTFLFGALVWLLREAGLRWRSAAAGTAIVLSLQEALQVYVPRATPEVTDPILALLIALSMYLVTNRPEPEHGAAQTVTGTAHPRVPRGRSNVDRDTGRISARHLGGLDGLRGLAALAVFGVHFNQTVGLEGRLGPFDLDRFFDNGNTGVALFFVLSGFLLSIPFWESHRATHGGVNLKAYAIRRVARILPAFYLCVLLIVSARVLMGGLPSIDLVLSHLLFIHNLKDSTVLGMNPPFWTLAVEMQFYLLLPLLFVALARMPSRVAFTIVVVLSIGTYLANHAFMSYLLARDQWPIHVDLIWPLQIQFSKPGSYALRYSLLAHLTFFLIGVGAAWLFLRREGDEPGGAARGRACDVAFWGAGLAVVAIISSPLDDVLQLPHGRYNWPVVPLLLATMVYTGPKARSATAFLDSRPLRWIGAVSYGVYIFHYPLMRVTSSLMRALGLSAPEHWLVFGVVSFVATMTLASISFVVLERPLMRAVRGERYVHRDGERAPQPAPPPAPAKERAGAYAPLRIGLTSEQIRYLSRVARASGKSISGATRHLVAEFITGMREGGDASPAHGADAATTHASGAGSPSSPAGLEYPHVINLRNEQVEFVGVLADRLGVSVSRTVQLIVDDFIKDERAREDGAR